jgi:hypothetical protein
MLIIYKGATALLILPNCACVKVHNLSVDIAPS